MAGRKATMVPCKTQPMDRTMDSRWNVYLYTDGELVRTIRFVTSMEAARRVKDWEE